MAGLAPDGGRVEIAGADPLTQPPSHSARYTGLGGPLGGLGTAVRAARGESFGEGDSPPPLWPTGLALQLVLASGAERWSPPASGFLPVG